MALLQEETSLLEIVRLVGRDTLSEKDQFKLDITKSLREDYLQQNAFHDVDTYCSLDKQYQMLYTILNFYDKGLKALENGAYLEEIEELDVVEKISRMKYVCECDLEEIDAINESIDQETKALYRERGDMNA